MAQHRTDEAVRAYRTALTLIDDYVARETARHPEHVRCRRRCASCRRAWAVHDAAALVASAFAELPPMARERARRRAWAVYDAAALDPAVAVSALEEADLDRRLERVGGLPCPFLRDGEECLIYERRPLICRLHGLPIRDAAGEVLDPGCHLNFVGVDIAALDGYTLDVEAFDRAEAAIREIAQSRRTPADPATEILLPGAILPPWWGGLPPAWGGLP